MKTIHKEKAHEIICTMLGRQVWVSEFRRLSEEERDAVKIKCSFLIGECLKICTCTTEKEAETKEVIPEMSVEFWNYVIIVINEAYKPVSINQNVNACEHCFVCKCELCELYYYPIKK